MANPVEHEPSPKDIEIRPEQIEVPEHIEKTGVQPTQTQYQQPVQDDDGQHMVHSPAISTPSIQIPKTQDELENMSKKKPVEAATWFAIYWLRMIRKALHKGWKVVSGGVNVSDSGAQSTAPQDNQASANQTSMGSDSSSQATNTDDKSVLESEDGGSTEIPKPEGVVSGDSAQDNNINSK